MPVMPLSSIARYVSFLPFLSRPYFFWGTATTLKCISSPFIPMTTAIGDCEFCSLLSTRVYIGMKQISRLFSLFLLRDICANLLETALWQLLAAYCRGADCTYSPPPLPSPKINKLRGLYVWTKKVPYESRALGFFAPCMVKKACPGATQGKFNSRKYYDSFLRPSPGRVPK